MLDGGAYCGEGGFFAQMAAMHALGPYELENVDVESSLVYSNNQPSSSIRAPTAPQVCWALEQHMDELAEALGLDPVELRRRTLIEEGSVTATGQVLEQIAMKETLERAVELIGAGGRPARRRGDRRRLRLVAVLPGERGRLRQAQPGRDGDDRDRRAGERHRRGDGDAALRRGGARDAARGLLAPLPGHGRRAVGHGLLRLADDVQQRARRARRRGRRARPAARRGVGEARGGARRPRARRRLGSRQGVAGQGGHDRRARRPTGTFHGKGAGELPEAPPAPAEGCVGRLGNESFHAPQLIAHAAHVQVDRETGVVRVLRVAAVHDCGRILNRIGADGQVYGGVVMGIGQALTEGTQLDELGRQRNPHLLDYKLVTASDAPAIDIDWIETDTPNAGPKGSKGVGEPPCVPTAGAIANAISKVIGARVRQLPMTPERVWEAGA